MRSLTTLGKIVLALLGALLIWGVWYLLGHIWYIEEEGYCWGSMAQCYAEEAK